MTLPAPAAILFDLDGTLVDTAPDLARATNRLRKHYGRPALDETTIRREVSHGGSALVTLALDMPIDHPEHDACRTQLLEFYGEDVAVDSRLFDGFADLVQAFKRRAVPWGIVTNKPRQFAVPLLEALNVQPDVLLCADDLPVKKPDPTPLLVAAERLGVSPSACWYLGDHERDVDAARRAGMVAIAVGYGYLRDEDDPASWSADLLFDTPADTTKALRAQLGL
ncbi:HAD-IA family hydrolase [Larsenimonas suaedae]|uniref:HAD-IA family hydrolase n=1 Tax=Larsenimonas suaedae TaxID=1851019 RepID=A0ABU1GVJ7_9GAMM|nr:HAD-IA family hydrolase [Larsenimonas suaedae]MCM2971359.1 HAD-IA family hydrolase [Larsenimonas suaedae]MDR5896070.1 HAD-IA family hydrolase [Larsenimonas suaedae]